jgi:serine/threonine protein kinase/class 3 adenylate cyclase
VNPSSEPQSKGVLLTLLFTDIVGSTRLKQELGDREMMALMKRHHHILRSLLAETEDAEEITTAGDSFFFTFSRPSDAARFALRAQSQLRAAAADIGRPIPVRIGIHVGEVLVEARVQPSGKRRDYCGLHVDMAARIMSLGQGGQILLSRAAFDSSRQALRGDAPFSASTIQWKNHGTYQLQGIEEPIEICEVGEAQHIQKSPPPDSSKGRRASSADSDFVGSWRPAAGLTVPRTEWVLEHSLGEGKFGEVWLGKHRKLGIRRAFRFCFEAARVRMLKREVSIFKVLAEQIGDHPNMVRVHDVQLDAAPFYLTMEYVDGGDLPLWIKSACAGSSVSLRQRVDFIAEVADALHAAHQAGILHRDIRPSNILISTAKGTPHALLTDFGVGQVLAAQAAVPLDVASTGATIDTRSSTAGQAIYFAPEVIAGEPATVQSDIYSLGVVLLQIALGDFGAAHRLERSDVNFPESWLSSAVADATIKEPGRRLQSAASLSERLRHGLRTRPSAILASANALSETERSEYLARACASDPALRAEIDAISGSGKVAGFINSPVGVMNVEREIARLKPEQPGDHIGPYKLLEQIGEGGFGTVWMADQHKPIRRRVALKVIKLGMDTKEVIARFEQERQALALMDHPHIAKVLDAGATQFGRPYFVMELVPGVRITDYCDNNRLPTTERIRLFIQVCNAVQHAHQKGIIHRDLKPSNILVMLHDGIPVPKIIDFGIAKATQQQRLTDLTLFTQSEQMMGTPLYMSPEQAERGGIDIDTRSDIYSIGVILYELLTGSTPFKAGDLTGGGIDELRRVIREKDPKRPSTALSALTPDLLATVAKHQQSDPAKLLRSVRGDLDWIVMKAIERDRMRRYDTASAFVADIQRHLDGHPILARPVSKGYRLSRFARRNRLGIGAGILVFTLLAAGLSASIVLYLREREAHELATNALLRLRRTAPTFASQASSLLEQGEFEQALATNASAIELMPTEVGYRIFRANLLQAMEKLGEAEAEYITVLKLNPGDVIASKNIAICRELLSANGGIQTLGPELQRKLLTSLLGQKRMVEAARLNAKFQASLEALLIALEPRLAEYRSQAGWTARRIIPLNDGTLSLNLSDLKIGDLRKLQGFPISELMLDRCELTEFSQLGALQLTSLSLQSTGIADLSAFNGLKLRRLDIYGTKVTALDPIRNMPLEDLQAGNTAVKDLTPLRGMPLRSLNIEFTHCVDLSPLVGMPLEELRCRHTMIGDISSLRSMKLHTLAVPGHIKDLSPLENLPLRQLDIQFCSRLYSMQPILSLRLLETLRIPKIHFETILLKNHSSLKRIGAKDPKQAVDAVLVPIDQFWESNEAMLRFAAQSEVERRRVADIIKMQSWNVDTETATGIDDEGGVIVDVSNSSVSNLEPLRGCRISTLMLNHTLVRSFEPLRGMSSLRVLRMNDIGEIDLEPLRGLPLQELDAGGAGISNLEPLRGMQLRRAHFDRCPLPFNVEPLSASLSLQTLLIPENADNIEELRKLPNLEYLGNTWTGNPARPARPAAEFWSLRATRRK